MSKACITRLSTKFEDQIIDTHDQCGDDTVIVKRDKLHEMVEFLRDDEELSFEMLTDLTGVDMLGVREPRFEVVYHFYSLSKGHRLRVKVPLEEDDPKCASIMDLYKAAYWQEREAFDLYGIVFEGHPDLRRILLYPEFEGHPLRKDYEMEERQPLIPPREGRTHL